MESKKLILVIACDPVGLALAWKVYGKPASQSVSQFTIIFPSCPFHVLFMSLPGLSTWFSVSLAPDQLLVFLVQPGAASFSMTRPGPKSLLWPQQSSKKDKFPAAKQTNLAVWWNQWDQWDQCWIPTNRRVTHMVTQLDFGLVCLMDWFLIDPWSNLALRLHPFAGCHSGCAEWNRAQSAWLICSGSYTNLLRPVPCQLSGVPHVPISWTFLKSACLSSTFVSTVNIFVALRLQVVPFTFYPHFSCVNNCLP